MEMNKMCLQEKGVLFLLASFIAVAGLYTCKMFSFLLPAVTILVVWFEGGLRSLSFRLTPPLLLVLLLILWGGISFFWAEYQKEVLTTYISLMGTFISAVLLLSCMLRASPALISRVSYVVKVAGLLLLTLVISQIFMDTFVRPLLGFQEGALPYMLKIKPTGSILSLVAFVGCGFLWVNEQKVLSVLAFLVVFLTVILTRCGTAYYGLVLATLVFCCSYLLPFWITRILMIFSYTFVIFSPLFFTHILSPQQIATSPQLGWLFKYTFFHRALGWEYYSQKFFEKPLLGHSIGSSPYLSMGEEIAPGFQRLLHPHNNGLQAYTELGLVGGTLCALLFASLFLLIEKHVKDRLSVAVCNATVTFGFIAAEITHNMWRNYWLSLVALTAGALIIFLKSREVQLRARVDHLKQSLVRDGEWVPQQS